MKLTNEGWVLEDISHKEVTHEEVTHEEVTHLSATSKRKGEDQEVCLFYG